MGGAGPRPPAVSASGADAQRRNEPHALVQMMGSLHFGWLLFTSATLSAAGSFSYMRERLVYPVGGPCAYGCLLENRPRRASANGTRECKIIDVVNEPERRPSLPPECRALRLSAGLSLLGRRVQLFPVPDAEMLLGDPRLGSRIVDQLQ
jgi:hypothetical protein